MVGPWFVDRFAATVPDLHYLVLLPPLAACLERVAARTDHGFTDADATRRMHREFAEADIAGRYLFTAAAAEAAAIQTWNIHYNYHRPHTAAGDQPPASRLHTGVTNVMSQNS